jgi:hypothetical protein
MQCAANAVRGERAFCEAEQAWSQGKGGEHHLWSEAKGALVTAELPEKSICG